MAKTPPKKSPKRPTKSAKVLKSVRVTFEGPDHETVSNLIARHLVGQLNDVEPPAGGPRAAPAAPLSWFDHLDAVRKDTGLTPAIAQPLPAPHIDDRGLIQNIVDSPVAAVAVISSKAGSKRASHWHREDSHLCYVISGEVQYLERPVGSTEAPSISTFKAGQAFYTGPNLEHTMLFPQDTVFLTLGNRSRKQEDYEADLVRLAAPLG